MQTFKLEMVREVVSRDAYDIEIEAESLEEAQEKAETMASDMNQDCPDGVTDTGYMECRSWEVRNVAPAMAEVA